MTETYVEGAEAEHLKVIMDHVSENPVEESIRTDIRNLEKQISHLRTSRTFNQKQTESLGMVLSHLTGAVHHLGKALSPRTMEFTTEEVTYEGMSVRNLLNNCTSNEDLLDILKDTAEARGCDLLRKRFNREIVNMMSIDFQTNQNRFIRLIDGYNIAMRECNS